ncbi:hypothetical protein [Nocardioides sp. L-11A]|uniref:hypothetical protein n=1 Tax=Nocardioides sp. L-11A TaxID=3043848 RepID=UPI00249B89C7|nr:hypothetical protein QJ852_21825 [Nocardioides sp. L-11A]
MKLRSLLKNIASAPIIAALVIVTLAVGGTAFAAGSITGKQIAKNTVTSKNIKNATIKTKDIDPAALAEIQANAQSKGNAYAVRRIDGALAQPANTTVDVKTLSLPAGTFTLMSRVSLDDVSGSQRLVQCQLSQGTKVLDSVYQSLPGVMGGYACTNMSVVTLSSPATITLRVLTPPDSQVRLGPDNQIIATQVASATVSASLGAN